MGRTGVVVVLVLAVSGCSYKHSGKAMIGGLVLGIGGTAFAVNAAGEDNTKTEIEVSLAVAAVGVVLFGIGALEAIAGPPPPAPPDTRPAPVEGTAELRRDTRVAQHMAAHGRCDQVQQIARRIVAVDRAYYERTFLRDAAIAKCTAAVSAPVRERPESPPR